MQARCEDEHPVWQWIVVCGVVISLGIGSAPHTACGEGHVEAGAKLYHERCAPCHGMDGKATTPMAQALTPKPRDHTDGAYMNQLSDAHIAQAIKNGGAAVGKSPMMPAQTDLSPQQLDDVVAFVRTLAVPPYRRP